MKIWRMEKVQYSESSKQGDGAKLAGGRWSSPGKPAVYCAEHLSLSVLEVLVHARTPEQRLAKRVKAQIQAPEALLERVPAKVIPPHFGPASPYAATQAFGDEWLRSLRNPGLIVPSALIPEEFNIVLNPLHPEYARFVWGDWNAIVLDSRLWAA